MVKFGISDTVFDDVKNHPDIDAESPGEIAYITVLPEDIFTREPSTLLKTRVLMTVIGGEIRYDGF